MSHHIYTKGQQARDDAERNALFLKVNGREMTYEDVIKAFGGRFCGASQNTGRRGNTGSQDWGVLEQT